MLGLYREGHPAGFFMALVGALVLLFAYHLLAGGAHRASIPRPPAHRHALLEVHSIEPIAPPARLHVL